MFTDAFQEKIWKDKYQYNDETYEQFCYRIADNIFTNDEKRHDQLVKFLMDFKGLFGGRINSNIGVDEEGLTLFNCFIESIVENPDSLEGIMDMVTKYAITLKTEGGVGFCANFLRPAKTLIRKIGVTTPGAIKFLEIFDKTSEVITSGSVSKDDSYQGQPSKKSIRKGATMVTMNINHPDIEEFISAKSTPNKLTKMNMSVLVTDAFMYAVKEDVDWDLWFPDINFEKYDDEWDGNFESWAEKGYPFIIYKTLPARELWQLLMKSTYNRNEPGIIFIDNVRKMDNLHYLKGGSITATNPSLRAGTKIITTGGVFPIEELDGKEFNVFNLNGRESKARCFLSGHNKRLYKINLSGGVTYYSTKEHKWPILCSGKYVKKETVEIPTGSYIPINQPKSSLPFGDVGTYADGFLIGWNLGDGSSTIRKDGRQQFSFICSEKDKSNGILDSIVGMLKSITGKQYNPTKRIGGGEPWYELHLSDIKIRNFFEKFRFVSKEYGLPASVWSYASEDFRKGLVDGLFSSDGYVDNNNQGRIVFVSSKERLANDVADLIGFYGIKSNIRFSNSKAKFPNKKDYGVTYKRYDLTLSKSASILFRETFKLSCSYKQRRLDSIELDKSTSYRATHREVLSVEETNMFEDVWDISVFDSTHCFELGRCITGNCGEIPGHTGLIEYSGELLQLGDVCNLGSINLTKYYDVETNRFCMDEFKQGVDLMVRSLDNVIEISNYPLKMYEDAAKLKRKIGIGLMGAASLMMMSNIRYGSVECVDLLEVILSEFINQAYQTSAILAKESGPFPLWDKKAMQGGFIKNSGVLKRVTLDLIKKHGLRNSALAAIAPNGTLSIVAGNVSGGLEPVFATEFTRWNRVEGKKVDFKYPNIHKGEWFETDYFKEKQIADESVLISNDGKYRIDNNGGLCKQVIIKDYGFAIAEKNGNTEIATAMELSVDEHLNVLKLFTKYIDQSSSKCISTDTRVTTDRGVVKIGDIHTGRKKDTFYELETPFNVTTLSGIKPINNFYCNGAVAGKRIKVKNGQQLSGSATHRIKVLNKDFDLVWMPLDDIKIGDIVPLVLGNDISNEKIISKILGKKFNRPKNCMPITLPTQLSKDLLWWLGCVIADGNVNTIGVHLTQVGGSVLDRFTKVTQDLFQRDVVITKDKRRDNLFQVSLNSKVLYEWMNHIGFSKEHVTELVFSASSLLKKSFLEGMTLDGYVTEQTICLKTDKSLSIVEEAQQLCLSVGIPTHVHKQYNSKYEKYYYNLLVSLRDIKTMATFLFPENHKQELFTKLYNSKAYSNKRSFAQYGLRFPINNAVVANASAAEKQASTSNSLYNILHRINSDAKSKRSLTIDQLFVLFCFTNNTPSVFDSGYLFTEVTEVDDVLVDTVDIGVESEHNYVANGFISHNTINLPNDISFEDFKGLYGEIHGYGIKGCTTYRAGTSVAVLETQKKEKNKSIKRQQKEFLDVFKEQENGDLIAHNVQLPDEYPAKGYILRSEGKKWYIHASFKDKACTKPFAVFVNTNHREDNILTYNALEKLEEIAKHKGLNQSFIEETKKKYAYQKNPVKICRMLGLLLRHNVDVYSIVMGMNDLETSPGTFIYRIKKFLAKFITDIHDPIQCPECGEKAIIFQGGCFECQNCGHTKC